MCQTILCMIFWNFRYSGLTIKYVRGADPIIKLLDDDETVIEVQLIVHFFVLKIT